MNIRRNILKEVNKDLFVFLILLIIFSIGVIIGAIGIKLISQDQHEHLVKYMNFIFNNLEGTNYTSFQILKQSLIDNFKIIIILIISSFSAVGIPIIFLTILYKGFAIGFSVGFLVAHFGLKGFVFSLIGILPQNLFVILGLLFIGSRSLNLAMRKVKNKKNVVYFEINNYVFIMIIYFIIIFLGSILESFFSNYFLRVLI